LPPPDARRRRLGRPARPRPRRRGLRRARGQGQPRGRARAVRRRRRRRRRRRPRGDGGGARAASHAGTCGKALTTEFTRGGNMATTDSTQALAHLWIHESPLADLIGNDMLRVFVSGEGGWLTDTRGDRYFDLCSSMWQAPLGHGREDIVEA